MWCWRLYGKIRMRFLSPEGQLIRAQLSSAYEVLCITTAQPKLLDSANAVVQEALDKNLERLRRRQTVIAA